MPAYSIAAELSKLAPLAATKPDGLADVLASTVGQIVVVGVLSLIYLGVPRILRSREVAEMLGISHATAVDWLEAGKLPGYKIGRSWAVWLPDLEAWLESNGNGNVHCNGNAPAARERSGAGNEGVSSDAKRTLRPVRD